MGAEELPSSGCLGIAASKLDTYAKWKRLRGECCKPDRVEVADGKPTRKRF
jgi:hypothetical protein